MKRTSGLLIAVLAVFALPVLAQTAPAPVDQQPKEEPMITPGMNWVVLRVASNKEDYVRETLLRKIKIEGCSTWGPISSRRFARTSRPCSTARAMESE